MKISAKRVNFISIQNSHTLACVGYRQPPVRTGYDSVVVHRTPDLFAKTAYTDATVVSITNDGIVLETTSGERFGYTLGRRFGNAAGLTLPHSIVTPLKLGNKVKQGDVVIYNDGFFEPDFFNPKQVVMKFSRIAKCVFWEAIDTFEDSCAISKKFAKHMSTKVTNVKTIVVSFDQAVHRLVKEGDHVGADSVLCIINDASSSSNDRYDERSLDILQMVSAQAPRAHVEGVVERIEVFYNGEKEDMSTQIKAIAESSDRAMKRRAVACAQPVFTGKVDGAMRIANNPLMSDQLAIKIYITTDVGMGIADKGVLSSQLKNTVGNILEDDYVTEGGDVIDIPFGMISVHNRIVNSPFEVGSANTALIVLAKRMVELYEA